MTRRDFIVGGLSAVAAGECLSSPVRSALGAERNNVKAPLPYDAEVEFIESTGTQWINTGYETDCLGITIDITASKSTNAMSEMALIGMVNSNIFELYFMGGRIHLWCRTFDITNQVSVYTDTVYHIVSFTDSESQSLSVNGEASSRTGSMGSYGNSKLTIFNYNERYPFLGRVYGCKIYDGTMLVRDFIPVKKDGIGYMYDRVHPTGGLNGNGLYANAGTEAFLIGPEA